MLFLCDHGNCVLVDSLPAMLTAPNEKHRPVFAAKDIKDFYLGHSPKILPQKKKANSQKFIPIPVKQRKSTGLCFKTDEGDFRTNVRTYNGKYLHSLLKEKLGETKLHETLTDVIPTFDIRSLRPVIFSSCKVKNNQSMDSSLSDICIGTSVAPTYFPAHFLKQKIHGKTKVNLVDGGVAANNPTLIEINQVTKEITKERTVFFPLNPKENGRFLVFSLGTGSPKAEKTYDAKIAAKWGVLGWLVKGGACPLFEVFNRASGDMVDYHISTVFQALHSQENYLRVATSFV